MGKKIFWCGIVVAGMCVVILFLTMVMPTIISFVGIAQADPAVGNFTGYEDALGASPLFFYFIPVIIAGLAIFFILRQPERG